jgi:septum formation protein
MIVLASQSPRRAELLQRAGIEFRVQPANIPEERLSDEKPRDYVRRLAREKATAIQRQVNDGLVVLGADTVVACDEHVLEKPRSAEDAEAMLRMLSGRVHQVMTGVCLAGDGFTDVEAEITEVRFTPITEQEVLDYVSTGEPMDKAGAYAIQGIASRWIAGLSGCYFNVVGLPVPMVYQMLRGRKLL